MEGLFKNMIILKVIRAFLCISIGMYSAAFFYCDWTWGSFLNNGLKIVLVSAATLIYCYGFIALIRDIKSGALFVIWEKIKALFNGR